MISPYYELVPTLHFIRRKGAEKREEGIGTLALIAEREKEQGLVPRDKKDFSWMEEREGVGIGLPVIKSRIEGTLP